MEDKRYLGDGVYVEFDGFNMVLTTENGVSVSNRIVLEPEVNRAYMEFVAGWSKERLRIMREVGEDDNRS